MGVRLGTLLLAFFFLFFFLLASQIHYYNKFKTKYSIRNFFPYELNYDAHILDNAWGNLCLALMTVSLVAFFVTFDITYYQSYFLPITIVGSLFAVLIMFIVLVPITWLKTHIAIVVSEFVLSVALPGTIAIAAFRTYQLGFNQTISLVVLIISAITAFFAVILVFNPGISLQIKMDKKVNENGEETYVRPKSIPLAYTEWYLLLTIFVDAILTFVLSFTFAA